MTRPLPNRFVFAALATTLLAVGGSGAYAQSADSRSNQDLEKENAALRARIHRLELEKENAGLHTRFEQLQGRQPNPAPQFQTPQSQASQTSVVVREQAPQTVRLQASVPDRTLVMADMPVKALPPALPVYSWTGFYLGGNVGYSVGSDRAAGTFAIPGFTDLPGPDTTIQPAGVIGGGQLGYNFQAAPNWLIGFEADFQGSQQKGTSCVLGCVIDAQATQTSPVTQQLDYFGTVRGRVGFVDNGALFYVTGGGAYGRINQSATATTIIPAGPGAGATVSTGSTIENKFGYAVGGGIEAALGGNWTAKVEYLFMNLGTTATSVNGVIPGAPAQPFNFTAVSNIRDNIVRVGLNYRVGGPVAPVSAYDAMAAVPSAARIYTWTGFYVGGNVGYSYGQDHTQTNEALPPILATSEPGTQVSPKGGVGGVQLGYNWQASPRWLIGFEGDLQGSAQTETSCASLVCFNQVTATGGGTNFLTVQHQIDYFGTLRGRLGAVANNNLFYLTGGAAFAHVKQFVNLNSTISTPPVIASGGTTQDMIGYAVGGGIESILWAGWSAKAEYLYMNLGNINTVFPVSSGGATATFTTNSTVRDHIVRVGANYHFDTAAPY